MTKDVIAKLQNLTLLYAEDEEGIRKNIADSLGYYVKEVIEASNGAEAYELYEQKKPDIILTDIHMPILNGIEFVKKVRQIDKKIPIIMITAHTDKEYLLQAVELKMEKYIVKPIELEVLFEVFKKCLDTISFNNNITLEIDNNYTYDHDKKELKYKDEIVLLNKKEISFFELLMMNYSKKFGLMML